MSTHSPGPWSVTTDVLCCDWIVDAEGYRIAEMVGCSYGANPNAKIMAAAPDLHDACVLARSQLSCNCGIPCCNTCDTIRQLDAAIQKAKGAE